MPILFAFLIMGFALHSINGLNLGSEARIDDRQTASTIQANSEIQLIIGDLTKRAFDYGRMDQPNCPTGTREIQNVNTGDPERRLCWSNTWLTPGTRCFRDLQYKSRPICFSQNQNSIAYSTPFHPLFRMLANSAVAQAYPPVKPYPGSAHYNDGIVAPTPSVNITGNPSQAVVQVTVPQPNTNSVRGNHVECNAEYTRCFTVIFCLNGTSTCTGRDKFTTTFAARFF